MFRQLTICVFLALAPLPAIAQGVQEQIINQLTDQGFGDFEISRTLLGRVRVVTQSDRLSRELVFNPNTGEILRDYWEPLAGSTSTPQIQLADPSGANNNDTNETRPPRPPRPPRRGPPRDGPRPDGPPPPPRNP